MNPLGRNNDQEHLRDFLPAGVAELCVKVLRAPAFAPLGNGGTLVVREALQQFLIRRGQSLGCHEGATREKGL